MTHAVSVAISRELVTAMLSTGHTIPATVCTEGLPPDAVLTGAGLNQYGELILRFEHHSFPECAEGAEAFHIVPVFSLPTTTSPDQP